MRVLLVSANYAPHVGGIERFTEILAAGLSDRGHEVHVVCCRHNGAALRERMGGAWVHRIQATDVLERRAGVPYPLPDPYRLLRCLRGRIAEADVVHVQDAVYATSLPALALAGRRGVPGVLTQHVEVFAPRRSPWLSVAEQALRRVGRRTARLATLVATYNPAVATWMNETWALEDVRVLPVGVREHVVRDTNRVELRRSFGLPADRFLALFVGRDIPKKGLDFFLGAGDPAYDLVAVTDREATDRRATILPFMPPERLNGLLECVDCFVLPSEHEGFPLVIQEALGAGLPVVTTSHPGYELYLAPDDAMFVERDAGPIRTAILAIATDTGLRQSLSERSRAVAERHFGAERFVSAYESVYEEAASLLPTPR